MNTPARILAQTPQSFKALGKMLLQSRKTHLPKAPAGQSIVILGNGPSLNQTIEQHAAQLQQMHTMAVNFAANTPQFTQLKPRYYTFIDPLFFAPQPTAAVKQLLENIAAATWPITLIVPRKQAPKLKSLTTQNPNITIAPINTVGIEAWPWLENLAFRTQLAMPRPRNVLIPAIMAALAMKYQKIYIAGADHSWMKTLSVNQQNNVISVQPHYYTESSAEQKRVDTLYQGLHLHQVILSFHIAFKAYHTLQRYALTTPSQILNITPGSMIDAFERSTLPPQNTPT